MSWNHPIHALHGGILSPSPPLRPLPARILLLEDEGAVREALSEALARNGYQVMAGSALEDGLEVLAGQGWKQVDLVLSDTHLSRDADIHNGHVFHERWRSLYPAPPFIFMDGWGNTLDRANVPDPSCQVYTLAKPFSLGVLLGLIRAVLGR